ncbi:tyrosine-protein phosphatase [Peribacillus frigoritolerans]|uniref:tyrosine-protein phosphatase n=1 Tax=Peribacillus frigoritolerans TaxID=450367 RepID=UPI000FD7BA6D|nr:CpsB/CapC family capsule biosynthesis tyrosine phosphatase [Peribacillus frigoritolerans]AZV63419.1 tyrosine protein phosphatase [Peribacillus frigoritolerans]
MIDLHCHILPGIDDGAQNLEESLAMAIQAVKVGITHLFATPHHFNGRFDNPKNEILKRVSEFNQCLQQENIPLTIHPGQELRIHRELFNTFERDEILTLDNRGKYLMLELPSGHVPDYTQEIIYELLLKGITPVIVHPERNRGLMQDKNLLFQLVNEGALTQLTAGSITGQFGMKIMSFSQKIIKHNLTHFIASDAHDVAYRGFSIKDAFDKISKSNGINSPVYFNENAKLLIKGQSLCSKKPLPFKKGLIDFFN